MPCAKLCLFAVFGQIWLKSGFSSIKSSGFFSAAICYRRSSLFKIWTELTLVTTSRSFIMSRHQIHKLKIWNHRFCSIPPFLTTSVDKPCGRNNCMIWLHHFHQLQHNTSRFFPPPREDESCGEPRLAGPERFSRVDPTGATGVSLASLFSYITGLKFELFISMFVGLFCQSVPGHDGSQSLDVGGGKNT